MAVLQGLFYQCPGMKLYQLTPMSLIAHIFKPVTLSFIKIFVIQFLTMHLCAI